MKHPHITTLEKAYSSLAKGDVQGFLAVCSDSVTFQIQGKSAIAGKFTPANLEKEFFGKMKELSSGSFKMELHDVLASDLHATVLMTCRLTRGGKEHEYRTVHVWRWDGDKPLAGYEYPRDLYQFDAIWS
jgi:ketosteroid isomerase-like protein